MNNKEENIKDTGWKMEGILYSSLPTYRTKTTLERMSDKEKKALEIMWFWFGK